MREPCTSALVSVVDACPDRQRLLAATLYALGCRIQPLDYVSGTTALREQLAASAPDVLVWQFATEQAGQCEPLSQLLHSGALEHTGVVITTPSPASALAAMTGSLAKVQVLAAPCSLIVLMRAVSAASRWAADHEVLVVGARAIVH